MAYCCVCGDEKNLVFRTDLRHYVCPSCEKETPKKVGFRAFQLAYFKDEPVTDHILREFFDDYLASSYTLDEYIEKTTSYV